MLPPLPPDPRDPWNPRDPGNPGMRSEASIFSHPFVDFEKMGKQNPKWLPNLKKSLPVQTKHLLAPKEFVRESDPTFFLPGRRFLTTLPSLSATCPYLNTIFFSRHAKIFYYSGPRTSPGRPRAERPPAARPSPGRPPAAAPRPPPALYIQTPNQPHSGRYVT